MSFLLSSGAINVIPDSGDLHARYDATKLSLTDGDAVSTWTDETGNGFDLTAGTEPTYDTNGINGNAVVRFDGTDDFLDVGFSALSQPNHIFIVYSFDTVLTDGTQIIYDSATTGVEQGYGGDGNGDRHMFAGSALTDGAADTNNHISGNLFNGANSVGRVDGSQIMSGDAGTDSLDGFRVGQDRGKNNPTDLVIGEILIYPQDKSNIQSDIESYLSDKWGVAV